MITQKTWIERVTERQSLYLFHSATQSSLSHCPFTNFSEYHLQNQRLKKRMQLFNGFGSELYTKTKRFHIKASTWHWRRPYSPQKIPFLFTIATIISLRGREEDSLIEAVVVSSSQIGAGGSRGASWSWILFLQQSHSCKSH